MQKRFGLVSPPVIFAWGKEGGGDPTKISIRAGRSVPKPLRSLKDDWDWHDSLFQVPRDQAWKSACGIFFERALPSLSSDRVDAARGKSCGTVGETGRHLRRQQEALSPIVGERAPAAIRCS